MRYYKKKVISIVILCSLVCVHVSAIEIEVDNISYSLNQNTRTASVTGSTLSNVVVPETIINEGITYEVTSIAQGAFYNNKTIKSIKTSNKMKTIVTDSYTNFYHYTSNVEKGAFDGATNLEEADFGENLEEIGGGAFYGATSLKKIKVGTKLTRIGDSAFKNCVALKYIVLPTTINSVVYKLEPYNKYDTFYGTSQLSIICLRNEFYTGYPNQTIYSNSFISFSEGIFTYNGKVPTIEYSFNGIGNGFQPTAVNFDAMEATAGNHTSNLTFTFSNDDMSFNVDFPYTYTINPARLTAKVKDTSRLYGDGNPEFTSTYTGFVNNEDASVVTSNGSYTTTATAKSDVGTYAIKQTGATAQNYMLDYEDGTLTVGKSPLTMSANNKTITYGSSIPTLDVRYEGLKNNETVPVWTSSPNITTTATQTSNVGTYPITISNAVPKNYELTINNGTLTVEKASLNVKVNNQTRKYGEANPEFTLSFTGLKNNETQPQWEIYPTIGTTASIYSSVGTYPITATNAVATNYELTISNGTLTVNKATLTAKANDKSREYGDNNPQLDVTYTGFVNGESENVLTTPLSISTSATKTSNVGDYPILVSGGNANNYTFSYKQGLLTVTKAPLSAMVNDATRTYGSDNPSFSLSYTGLKNNETVPAWTSSPTFSTTASKASDVGTYSVSAGCVAKNYDVNVRPGTLTITPASLTLKANNASRQYYGDNPEFTFTCSGFKNNENSSVLTTLPSFTSDAVKSSNVGTYTITPSGAYAKNYAITYQTGVLTITKRNLTAIPDNKSRIYGEANPDFTISYSGFVNNDTESSLSEIPSATSSATFTSAVGDYTISLNGGSAMNYNLINKTGTLTITKAPLSAMVNDATKVYGSDNPSFTIDYYGLKNGETAPAWTTSPTFQTEATKQSGVGQYTVNAVNGVPKNYDLGTITPGTLIITPAPLTIKANNAVRQYYTDNPTFSYTCDGLVSNDNNNVLSPAPTLSTTANKSSNVGTYEISVEGASSPNYSISYTNGTLTITPRTLMASVGNYSRPYNEENPEFEVLYSGFVGNDDKSVLNEEPVASTTAIKTSDVGTYQIYVSGGDADNYTFSYTSGSLTINKAEQTISWDEDFNNAIITVGDQVELKAQASSGLPVTYTVSNSNIAEVYTAGSKTYLDCFGLGQVQVLAVQEGNKNYYSSPRVRKVITIDNDDAISSIDESEVKIQSSSFGVKVTGVNKGEKVRVYTVDGKLRHSIEADSQSIDIPLKKGGIYIIQFKDGTKKKVLIK